MCQICDFNGFAVSARSSPQGLLWLTMSSVSAVFRRQMERQILMQNQMRERQMAMQIAWSREFLKYFGTFFTLASVGLTAGWVVSPGRVSVSHLDHLDLKLLRRARTTLLASHVAVIEAGLSEILNSSPRLLFSFSAMKRKKPLMMAPLFPLSFILAYQLDSGYGTLIHRMRGKTLTLFPKVVRAQFKNQTERHLK